MGFGRWCVDNFIEERERIRKRNKMKRSKRKGQGIYFLTLSARLHIVQILYVPRVWGPLVVFFWATSSKRQKYHFHHLPTDSIPYDIIILFSTVSLAPSIQLLTQWQNIAIECGFPLWTQTRKRFWTNVA